MLRAAQRGGLLFGGAGEAGGAAFSRHPPERPKREGRGEPLSHTKAQRPLYAGRAFCGQGAPSKRSAPRPPGQWGAKPRTPRKARLPSCRPRAKRGAKRARSDRRKRVAALSAACPRAAKRRWSAKRVKAKSKPGARGVQPREEADRPSGRAEGARLPTMVLTRSPAGAKAD
jgi:hypothetical protein